MFILIGLLVGFVAAIPLGPINAFVLSQTLKRGFFHGLLAGITAAVLDFVYCLAILAGFFHIKFNLSPALPYLKVIAAGLLFAIGLRLFIQSRSFTLSTGPQKPWTASARPMVGTLLLYISNPSLYFFWFAVAGTMTAHGLVRQGLGWAALFSFACGVGSTLWYLMIVRYISNHKHKIRQDTIRKLFVILALLLAGFALFTIGSLFF